jgi:serine/threonine-protein phosphatase 2A activator
MADRAPGKRIASAEHVAAFAKSDSCAALEGFIRSLSAAARGRDTVGTAGADDAGVRGLLAWLGECEARLAQFPPLKVHSRFGNPAFRQWLAAVRESAESDCARLLGAAGTAHKQELAGYFWNSFGNATRLDYGTGHESSFAVLLLALHRAGGVRDLAALALAVFPRYLDVAFAVQSAYRLEPAGSHGVWSLDDYHILPFVLGSAQLLAPADKAEAGGTGGGRGVAPSPKSVRDRVVAESLAGKNLYCRALRRIMELKSGPFNEHSPMLFDISANVKTWAEVHEGMLRMYRGEVLLKFPVAQHFLFGPLFPHTWPLSDAELKALEGAEAGPGEKPGGAAASFLPLGSTPFPSPFKSPFATAATHTGQGDGLVTYFHVKRRLGGGAPFSPEPEAAATLVPARPTDRPLSGQGARPSSAGGAAAAAASAAETAPATTAVDAAGAAVQEHELLEGGTGIRIRGWQVTTHKQRISSEQELDAARESHTFEGKGLDFPLPEMMYGGNFARFTHLASGITVEFNGLDGASGCKISKDAQGVADRTTFKLPISDRWAKREDLNGNKIKAWREDYDWTYTTTYGGSLSRQLGESGGRGGTAPQRVSTPARIDYELLKAREPILFYDTLLLYEDDLFDFGESKLSVKLRVMGSCLFALCRCYLRVDKTFVRCFDTRLFHAFGSDQLLLETTRKEATYEQLGFAPGTDSKKLMDEEAADKLLPVILNHTQAVKLG